MRPFFLGIVEWAVLRFGVEYVVGSFTHNFMGGHPAWIVVHNVLVLMVYLIYALFGPSPAKNPFVWGKARPLYFAGALVIAAVFLAGRGSNLSSIPSRLGEAFRPLAFPRSTTAYLLAPIKEELLYRGILLRRLSQGIGVWPAIGVSSIIFALRHPNPFGAGLYGIWLGSLYSPALGANLALPIVLHILANLTGSPISP